MKHLIPIFLPLLLAFIIVGCFKDEVSKEQNIEVIQTKKYFSVEDFDPVQFLIKYLRNGGQNPFLFITSGLLYDPFKPGSPQTAFNLQKVVKSEYFRISEPGAYAWDKYWDIYNVTFYFADGTTKYLSRVYVENSIGAIHTHYHNINYNQVAISNPNNYVVLVRGARYEKYWDNYCGLEKRRYPYTSYFGRTIDGLSVLDSVGTNTLESSQCNANILSYQLITIP